MESWKYEGHWALITGASAGFGEEFARALARRGMHLVLTARRVERLERLARDLRGRHPVEVVVVPCDLSVAGAAEELWGEATTGREIHLLINNAGIGAKGAFHAVERERQVALLQLNVVAVTELAHLALAGMRARGKGGILNISSAAAFQPLPTVGTYAASKSFVLSLSEALWEENRHAGVRVTALCPGRSPTEFQQQAGTTKVSLKTPGALSPAHVVESGLRALERGKSYSIPGAINYINSFAIGLLPRRLFVAAVGKLIHRYI
jgi:uncharacterized protein